jgi:hypothetical protein
VIDTDCIGSYKSMISATTLLVIKHISSISVRTKPYLRWWSEVLELPEVTSPRFFSYFFLELLAFKLLDGG